MIAVAPALLAWYERHGRTHLPWRRTRDPYAVLVSEFMLQQTQVERVIPIYEAFLQRFPTFSALAAADAGDVIRAWRGLGYNSRAQRLRALARAVVHEYDGALPRAREALAALPGIGPYTASAVRAFAFGERDAAVDTNVRRIVHRVTFGLEIPPLAGERALDAAAQAAVPPERGHDWNSAVMDLGATICTARAPKCLVCPLRERCAAAPVDSARLAALLRERAERRPGERVPFEQSMRFLRGRIVDRLRDLAPGERLTLERLRDDLAHVVPPNRLASLPHALEALDAEAIVEAGEGGIALRSI